MIKKRLASTFLAAVLLAASAGVVPYQALAEMSAGEAAAWKPVVLASLTAARTDGADPSGAGRVLEPLAYDFLSRGRTDGLELLTAALPDGASSPAAFANAPGHWQLLRWSAAAETLRAVLDSQASWLLVTADGRPLTEEERSTLSRLASVSYLLRPERGSQVRALARRLKVGRKSEEIAEELSGARFPEDGLHARLDGRESWPSLKAYEESTRSRAEAVPEVKAAPAGKPAKSSAFSWKIFSAFGIPVHIHATFPLVALVVAANFHGTLPWLQAAAMPLLIYGSVLVHEYGHALTARRFGIETKRILMHLLGGAALMAENPHRASDEFWLTVMGPAMNLPLAGLFRLAALAAPGAWSHAFALVSHINLVIAAFNVFIPAYPMDGGRLLHALLWKVLGDERKADRTAALVSLALAVIGGAVSLAFGLPNFVLLALFVGWMAFRTYQQSRMEEKLQQLRAALEAEIARTPKS